MRSGSDCGMIKINQRKVNSSYSFAVMARMFLPGRPRLCYECLSAGGPALPGRRFSFCKICERGVTMALTILKGTVISAPALGKLDVTERGYLIAEEGKVTGVFPVLPERYAGAAAEDFGDALILQAPADLHLHAPQYPMMGMGTPPPLG